MSPQRLLCPLWHESLAQPLTSWVSGRHDHGRFVYGSAGLAATDGLFGNEPRNLWLTCAAVADLGEANPPSHTGPAHISRTHRRIIMGTSTGKNRPKYPQSLRVGCAILRNPSRGVICPVAGVAGRYDRRK
jgi:hypothetical protein